MRPGDAGLRGRGGDGSGVALHLSDERLLNNPKGLAVGRDPSLCEWSIADDTVSGRHARLRLVDGELWIEDLNSTNGTQVNGVDISKKEQPTRLRGDERIVLGGVELSLSSL